MRLLAHMLVARTAAQVQVLVIAMRKLKCKFCGIEFDANGPRKFCDLCKDMISEVRKRKYNRELQEARRRENEILAEAAACAGPTGGRSRRRGSLGSFVCFAPDLDGCRVEWRGTVPAHLRFVHGQGGM